MLRTACNLPDSTAIVSLILVWLMRQKISAPCILAPQKLVIIRPSNVPFIRLKPKTWAAPCSPSEILRALVLPCPRKSGKTPFSIFGPANRPWQRFQRSGLPKPKPITCGQISLHDWKRCFVLLTNMSFGKTWTMIQQSDVGLMNKFRSRIALNSTKLRLRMAPCVDPHQVSETASCNVRFIVWLKCWPLKNGASVPPPNFAPCSTKFDQILMPLNLWLQTWKASMKNCTIYEKLTMKPDCKSSDKECWKWLTKIHSTTNVNVNDARNAHDSLHILRQHWWHLWDRHVDWQGALAACLPFLPAPSHLPNQVVDLDTLTNIVRAQTGRAAGMDGWSGNEIAYLPPPVLEHVQHCFALFQQHGFVPTTWTYIKQVHVPKSANSVQARDWRPIAVMSIWYRSNQPNVSSGSGAGSLHRPLVAVVEAKFTMPCANSIFINMQFPWTLVWHLTTCILALPWEFLPLSAWMLQF